MIDNRISRGQNETGWANRRRIEWKSCEYEMFYVHKALATRFGDEIYKKKIHFFFCLLFYRLLYLWLFTFGFSVISAMRNPLMLGHLPCKTRNTTNHWQIENPIRCNLTLAHQTGPETFHCANNADLFLLLGSTAVPYSFSFYFFLYGGVTATHQHTHKSRAETFIFQIQIVINSAENSLELEIVYFSCVCVDFRVFLFAAEQIGVAASIICYCWSLEETEWEYVKMGRELWRMWDNDNDNDYGCMCVCHCTPACRA